MESALDRSLQGSEAIFLRMTAYLSSIQVWANISDALQKQGSLLQHPEAVTVLNAKGA